MRRFNLLFKTFLLLAVSISLYSCTSDTVVEPPPPVAGPLPVRTVSNLPADTAGNTFKYTYFSLKDSSIVTGADTATNKWDIAFRSTTIRINGGADRFGIGGAIVYEANFDTTTTAPETGFAIDTSSTRLAIPTGLGNGWYNYDSGTNSIFPITSRILLIKTGDGKYAKVQILSYYKNADPQPPSGPTNFRWYTFKYVYQPDGSRSIK